MAFADPEGGVIVTGKHMAGKINIGDEVEIVGLSPTTKRAVVADKDRVYEGTLFLPGLTKSDVKQGQVLATPGAIKAYTQFLAHVSFSATKARIDPQPFFGTFRSLFHIWHTDFFGTMYLPEGTDVLNPGDEMDARIELQKTCAVEVGLTFGIGRLMGRGTVTVVLE